VAGDRDSKRDLNKSSDRVGVGWPHLPGETEEETKVTLIDYNCRINRNRPINPMKKKSKET